MNAGWILMGLLIPAAGPAVLWSNKPIEVDGMAREPVWNRPETNGLKMAWDRQFLYLFAPDPKTLEDGFYLEGKGKVSSFKPNARGIWEWGVGNLSKIPSQLKSKSSSNGLEMAIPWVEFSPLGGRPEPDTFWVLKLGTKHPEPVTFQGKGPGPGRVGVMPWKGSPEPGLPYKTRPLFAGAPLPFPVCIAPVPQTDAYFVSTQPGPYAQTTLQMFRAGNPKDVQKVLELDGVIYDIVFHPQFSTNRQVFIGANGKFGTDQPHKTRVIRYEVPKADFPKIDLKTAKTIIDWESNGHNGGAICFGKDGMMYVTSGDGTSDSDLNLAGQDTTKKLAKVLRIDVDHPEAGKSYSVPKDNPWVSQKDFVPEAWAMGLRNPWRISCDMATGNIWVGNNGQDLWETVYLIRKGDNYGWSVLEGSHDFYPDRKAGPKPFAKPAAEHHHVEARSLTGGVTYHGKKFPDLKGCYLYGDYSTGKIWALSPPEANAVLPLKPREIADTAHQITGFALDHDGELLILDHLTGIQTLDPNPMAGKKGNFPTDLGASGLFQSVKNYQVRPGILAYEVNSPFWSDGAFKVRHAYIPDKMDPNGNPIPQSATYAGSGPWNFPDGTVIIKSFALETEPGNEASRRWIETRFMVKEENEWAGYTYSWNEQGTEATLVGDAGANREIGVGATKQTWRYPSRAECMVCHSRAAGFVLGLCDLQMNREILVGGKKVNQMEFWEGQGRINQTVGSTRLEAMKERAKTAGVPATEMDGWISARSPAQGFPAQTTVLDLDLSTVGKLPTPLDPGTGTLEQRARSYLHVNCSVCHVEAGGGNSKFRLDWGAKVSELNLIDVVPSHTTFGLPQARLVAPGFPQRSVLLHRLATLEQGKMPPVGKNVTDKEGAKVIEEWIRSMSPTKSGGAPTALR